MLRLRLPLLVLATVLVALLAVVFLAEAILEQQQFRDQSDLLQRELDRVTTLLRENVLGESFLDDDADLIHLQFVRTDGVVAVPADATDVIPLAGESTSAQFQSWPVVVASAPWLVGGTVELGTVRLAYDTRTAMESRRNLRAALLLSGAGVALIAGVAGMFLVRRQLAQLTSLARQAGALDPSTPDFDASAFGNDEVGMVASALEAASSAIKERTLAERQALGSVAHELGAPLSVIAGQLEALSQESADPRLLAARDSAVELLHTSQDLLALSQGELRTRIELEVTSLGAVASSVAMAWPAAQVTVSGDDQLLGSPPRLAQVVRNLLRNAFQSGSTTVMVQISGTQETVTLSVADDGPGIAEADRQRVFDRDYSVRQGGNGIGLAVVRQLVEAHGGSVHVGESPAGGAEFRAVFPSLAAELNPSIADGL